jgi:(1->4)-alpha-D-glucan 1-alpha-D-glucosylmutase
LQDKAATANRLELAQELIAHKEDGRVKLYVTWQALCCRREHPGLFSAGEYIPLGVVGPQERNVFVFARRLGVETALIVAPRLLSKLCPAAEALPVGSQVWSNTSFVLPAGLGNSFGNILTGESVGSTPREAGQSFRLADVLKHFPVALLIASSPE